MPTLARRVRRVMRTMRMMAERKRSRVGPVRRLGSATRRREPVARSRCARCEVARDERGRRRMRCGADACHADSGDGGAEPEGHAVDAGGRDADAFAAHAGTDEPMRSWSRHIWKGTGLRRAGKHRDAGVSPPARTRARPVHPLRGGSGPADIERRPDRIGHVHGHGGCGRARPARAPGHAMCIRAPVEGGSDRRRAAGVGRDPCWSTARPAPSAEGGSDFRLTLGGDSRHA